MHVIIANGAPFSGKDTLVKHILEAFPDAVWMRFKNVLYTETWKDLFLNADGSEEISIDEWIEICNDVVLKDKPLPYDLTKSNIELWKRNPDLYGNEIYSQSPRKYLISKSEDDIKKEHGEGGVAVITAGYIKEIPNYQEKLIVFSDGGFNCEINVLCEELGITKDEITVIRIEADGCNFDNDSREFIDNPKFTLFNDKTNKFFELIEETIFKHIENTPLVKNDQEKIVHLFKSNQEKVNYHVLPFDFLSDHDIAEYETEAIIKAFEERPERILLVDSLEKTKNMIVTIDINSVIAKVLMVDLRHKEVTVKFFMNGEKYIPILDQLRVTGVYNYKALDKSDLSFVSFIINDKK